MVNSSALWPLLLPQWKDPKKWWKELCTADGRKDYDWAGSGATAHASGPPNPRAASDKYRTEFLRDHPAQAAEIRAKEEQRRERKRNKADKEAGEPDDVDSLFEPEAPRLL